MNSPAQKVGELLSLLYSVLKWFLLALIAGVLVGATAALFLNLLHDGELIVAGFAPWLRYVLLPLGLLASTLLVVRLAPEAKGHGTEKVIEAIHRKAGRMTIAVIPVKLVATIITLSVGGSAGKEGPCAQIGAGITSTLATWFRFNDEDRKKLVICGISAGFAAIFGTPVAGAVFGIEVLFIGQMFYDVMLPSFVSGIVAYHTALLLGITYPSQTLYVVPALSGSALLWVLAAGVFFGIVSLVHIESLGVVERFFHRLRIPYWQKPLLGGFLLLGATFLFGPLYLGLGMETVNAALAGSPVPPVAFLLKSLFTGVTLGCGGSGGIVTPTLFVGATAGSLFALITGLDGTFCAALGLTSVLAGAANTPVAATIMAMELFGAQLAPLGALSAIIAFVISGHRSVYPSQVLARPKSRILLVEKAVPVDESLLKRHTSDLLPVRLWLRGKRFWVGRKGRRLQ
jgi:H+/Cl- antiporter ClcA